MPQLTAVVTVILLIFSTLDSVFDRSMLDGPFVAIVLTAVHSFLLTPFLIAVHRFILIDEVTPRYVLSPHDPRFQWFFGWSVALAAIWIGATVVERAFGYLGLSKLITATGMVLVVVVGLVLSVRLTILFPAIAVGAPGASLEEAFEDTKGYFWNIFVIFGVAGIPLAIVAIPLAYVQGSAANILSGWKVVEILDVTISSLIVYPLYVALASRLFQALAQRVLHLETRLSD
jgi:hypothetical protein